MYEIIRTITDYVKLIKVNNQILILKKFRSIEQKSNTIEFINILTKNSLPTIQFFEFDWLDDDSLCLEYIPKFHTFDKKKSIQDYSKVGQGLGQIHKILRTGIGNLTNNNIMLTDHNVYFLNPTFDTTKNEDIELFLKNNLAKSKHFTTSLNQQETKQNDFLEVFQTAYHFKII